MAEWSNAADSKSVIGLVSIWGSNPHLPAKVNKSSKKATFSFIYKHLSQFNWTQHKKSLFSSTIELTVAKVADFIAFHILGAV